MNIELANIPFKDFINLSSSELEQHRFALHYGKFEPKDSFNVGDILQRSFSFVKDLQFKLIDGLTFENTVEFISEKMDLKISDVAKTGIFTLQQQRLFFRDEIQKVNDIESFALRSDISGDEEAAGIDVFSEYKSFLQYDSLADGDLTKFKDIENLPYMLCLTKLKLNKDRSDFEKRLNNILLRKH